MYDCMFCILYLLLSKPCTLHRVHCTVSLSDVNFGSCLCKFDCRPYWIFKYGYICNKYWKVHTRSEVLGVRNHRKVEVFWQLCDFPLHDCAKLCSRMAAILNCPIWRRHWELALAPGRFGFSISKTTSVPNFMLLHKFAQSFLEIPLRDWTTNDVAKLMIIPMKILNIRCNGKYHK